MLLLILTEVGCNTADTFVDFNQKQIRLVLIEDEEGRRYVDEEESVCFMRRYRIGKDMIGPLPGGMEEMDILKCNQITGESPMNYAKKTSFLEEVRQLWLQ